MEYKICHKCGKEKPLTEEFWYHISARKGHKSGGWQSHCKECWIEINKENKRRRKTG